jgi:hypothetical protein
VEDRLLAVEMGVQAALGQAGPLGDVVDAGVGVALAEKAASAASRISGMRVSGGRRSRGRDAGAGVAEERRGLSWLGTQDSATVGHRPIARQVAGSALG